MSGPVAAEHDHDHAHGHDHDHAHGHHHHHGPAVVVPGDAEAHRAPLTRGAGVGKTLYLDAFSGVAGDMTIAALVDLGVPFQVVQSSVATLGLDGFTLDLKPARGGVIGGTKFDVTLAAAQPDRRYRAIDELIRDSSLAAPVKSLARAIFLRLAEAESEVHRSTLDSVAFHEVGAVDAIVDIVGAAACFEFLGAHVVSSALPMGRRSPC